jgi:adapter protein MecA 1/2
LGFDPKGPLVVEVFAIPTQGMLVVVSRRLPPLTLDDASKEAEEEEEEYDLAVTLEEADTISYAFMDFEHVVAVSKRIGERYTDGGTLYRFKGEWVLQIEYDTSDPRKLGGLIANLSEFGEACSVTANILAEYGLVVMEDNAIEIIRSTF